MSCASLPVVGPIKRGDTFALACTWKLDGVATDVTPYTIRAQLRDSAGTLVADLTATKDADQVTNPGLYVLTASGGTAAWPVDKLRCDIEMNDGSTVRSSSTFAVQVEADVTV